MQELLSAASSASSRLRGWRLTPGRTAPTSHFAGSSRTEPAGQARNDFRERPARDGTAHCARCRRRRGDGRTCWSRRSSLATPASRAPRMRAASAAWRGLARAGDTRVRRGMIQLAWRFSGRKGERPGPMVQARTADGRGNDQRLIDICDCSPMVSSPHADGRGNTRKTEAIATGINVHRVSAVDRHWARSCGCRRRVRAFHARQHNTGHGSGGDRYVVRRHCHRIACNPLGTVLGGMVMQS